MAYDVLDVKPMTRRIGAEIFGVDLGKPLSNQGDAFWWGAPNWGLITKPYGHFSKIIRGEIPCKKAYEDAHVLAFHDINPQAPVHVLVIPKGAYVSWDDFTAKAPDEEVAGFIRAVGHVARELGLPAPGYRLLANIGGHGHQEVPHLHVHVFAGRPLGPRRPGTLTQGVPISVHRRLNMADPVVAKPSGASPGAAKVSKASQSANRSPRRWRARLA
uniref:histidine triad nucleotide-binding protein n=1 Tax=uncultured Caulobacter sp. TaxID=158749 RepID=UPI0026044341